MLSGGLLQTDLHIKSGIQSLKDNLSPKSKGPDPMSPSVLVQANSSPRPQSAAFTAQTGPGSGILNSLDYALGAPTLYQRCAEVGVVLDKCPQKDLATAYTRLIDKVFSLATGGRGFGVGFVLRSSAPRDFYALADFLGVTGPVLRACSKLLADPYLKFEFPTRLLSTATQLQIDAGTASQFVMSKLSPQNSSILLLNSFEYYMFTFAAYIVQPYTVDNKFVAGDSLYPHVLEDYFSYFLPCDGSLPPQSPLPFSLNVSGSAPAGTSAGSADTSSQSPSRKSLLRQGTLLASPSHDSPVPPRQESSQEVWRSEALVSIVSELWLSAFSVPARTKSESPSLNQKTSDIVIAVGDTLRIVRMMIKHLHFFANSGGPLDVTPLDVLKRSVLQNIKKRIYLLFKYVFSHWPHDSSFRLVLETWLSYIQPWRYTDSAVRSRTSVVDEASAVTSVDVKWQAFVAENIFFYTSILRLLLPRFFRMDLTASKNAQMLFRIAKIYSQPGLSDLVMRGEAGLQRIMTGGELTLTSQGYTDMPLSLTNVEVTEPVIWSVKQCLYELEGPGSRHEPIFGNLFRQTVSEILSLAARARALANASLSQHNQELKESKSLFSSFIDALAGSGTPLQNSSEVDEFRKTVQFLSQAVSLLTGVFDLQPPQELEDKRALNISGSVPGSPEMSEEAGGKVLTPHGRWQVLQGIAKPEVRYGGDPELVPISNLEVTWLVRLMYRLSCSINNRFEDLLEDKYREEGVQGELCRLLVQPPCRFYRLEKSVDGAPPRRIYQSHKPRVSLRFVGSFKFLIYAFVGTVLFSLLSGMGVVGSVALILFMGGVIAWIMALCNALLAQTKPRPNNLDSSLSNHSKLE